MLAMLCSSGLWVLDDILRSLPTLLCISEKHSVLENQPIVKPKERRKVSTSARPCPSIPIEDLKPYLFSKQKEDETLLQWFNGLCNGTYIEMGALDGLRSSNTHVFNKVFGWKGVLVELSPKNYQNLVKNRPNEIATVNAAVCASGQTVHWYQSPSNALSGVWEFTNESYRRRWWKNATLKDDAVAIECSPLNDILKQHARQHSFFDIFSLDVEGAEFQVLKSFNFNETSFGIIVVENDDTNQRKNMAVKSLLRFNGYNLVQRLGNNDIFANNQFGYIYEDLASIDVQQDDPVESEMESEMDAPVKEEKVFLFDASNSSLKLVNIRKLLSSWKSNTLYHDLLPLASGKSIPANQAISGKSSNNGRTVILSHAVPKTAGTTVRAATFRHINRTCPSAGKAASQEGAFGHINIMKELIQNCTSTQNYALAGHLTLPPINDKDLTIIHTVAFRNYVQWSKSAMNQIVKKGGMSECEKLQNLLTNCKAYRELDFSQYSKTQLERIYDKSLSHSDILIMYDYKDTNVFQSTIRSQLSLQPLVLKSHNIAKSDETCPLNVLELFHKCHDLEKYE
jgi:FkbM family methyltransferase